MAENTYGINANRTEQPDYRVDLHIVWTVCVYVPCLSHNICGFNPVQMGTEWLYTLFQATQPDTDGEG